MKKTIYVCGFLFDLSRQEVALIKKTRPDWQKGLLNGIGGHVNDGEELHEAMEREFTEETGAEVLAWKLFCTYEGSDYTVYFMKTFSSEIYNLNTITDEEVKVINVSELNNETLNGLPENKTIPNLKWLIPLALDSRIDHTTCIEHTYEEMKES